MDCPHVSPSNGINTKVWGESGWIFNHCVSFNYPVNPTPEQKAHYYVHFVNMGHILPCNTCSESYRRIIATGDTVLNDAVLTSRDTLTRWLYLVHQRVNEKLGIFYGVTFEEFRLKYESYRACSLRSPEPCCEARKAEGFKNRYNPEAAIIPQTVAVRFVDYAHRRGIRFIQFLELSEMVPVEDLKSLSCWRARNRFCWATIRRMRQTGVGSLESAGRYQGLPTLQETELIMFLCSTMPSSDLVRVADLLNRLE